MSQLAERSTAPAWLHSPPLPSSAPQATFSDLAAPSSTNMRRRVWQVGQGVSVRAKIQNCLGIGERFHEVKHARPWPSERVETGSWFISASTADLQKPTAAVSTDCARFARQHGMWGSLVMVRSLVLRHVEVVAALEVELVRDAEIPDLSIICFVIRTRADLQRVLDVDDELRVGLIESLPPAHQDRIAIRFEFA